MEEKDIRIVNEIIEQISNISKEDLDKAIKMADEEYLQEDIKVLNNFKEKLNNINEKQNSRLAQAIENLIKGYKELEEKVNKYEKQIDLEWVEENYIEKSKVRKKIKELEKQMEKDEVDDFGIHSIGWSALDYIVDYLKEELLQEGDK